MSRFYHDDVHILLRFCHDLAEILIRLCHDSNVIECAFKFMHMCNLDSSMEKFYHEYVFLQICDKASDKIRSLLLKKLVPRGKPLKHRREHLYNSLT